MRSILQEDKRCYICGSVIGLERHHIFAGVANKPISERYGLWVWLCARDHRGTEGAQYDKDKNRMLKEDAQAAFEETHSHEEWMRIIRKNYLPRCRK